MNVENLLSKLKEKGFRITKTRKSMLQIFSEMKSPLSAQDVIQKLSSNEVHVNKTTVYREIQFLLDQNYLTELKISGPESLYELSFWDHHHHVICNNCGTINDIEVPEKQILKDVQKNTNFVITDHALEFYGLCYGCQ